MSLNCLTNHCTLIEIMTQLDNNHNADLLDAMADMAYEQEEAMREAEETEWSLIEHGDKFIGFTTTNSMKDEWEGVTYDDEYSQK